MCKSSDDILHFAHEPTLHMIVIGSVVHRLIEKNDVKCRPEVLDVSALNKVKYRKQLPLMI